MSVERDYESTKKRLAELERKLVEKNKNTALRFFKKNKIEDLLKKPEILQEFTKEITGVIKKYQQQKIVTGEPLKEDVKNE